MIDIHCHILPDVDDGAKNWDEAIKMARIAEADGIHTIVSTSHFIEESQFVMGQVLREHIRDFNEVLKKEGINIVLLLGNEAYLTPDLVRDVKEKKVFTINQSRYLLIEFPMHMIPFYTEDVLYQLRLEGIVPIIAHPERYSRIMDNPMLLYPLIQQGSLIQVNAGSLSGHFGKKVQDTCKALLRHNMVHLIGSDGHSPRGRKPELSKAVAIAENIIGWEKTQKLVLQHPRKIIEDQGFFENEPLAINMKEENILKKILSKIVSQQKTKKELVSDEY